MDRKINKSGTAESICIIYLRLLQKKRAGDEVFLFKKQTTLTGIYPKSKIKGDVRIMKLAFSTLGCPGFDWPDIYSMAKDLGFHGIELRGLGGNIFSVKAKPFADDQIPETLKQLKRLRLEISCLSSGCALKYAERYEENLKELREYMELAAKLGTPYIRVLGDEKVKPEGEVDDALVIRALKELAPEAEEKGVTLLVETNGVYADSKRLAELLNEVGSDAVAALWDTHHPYRVAGEAPGETLKNLGAYIKYTHIKDSVVIDGEIQYRMMGEGDIPVDEIMRALRSINYEGYVTLEWVRSYMPELQSAGIVFPQYVHYMTQYMDQSSVRSSLIPNRAGTGHYVWPHEHLIDLTFPQLLDRMVEEFPDQIAFDYSVLDYTRTYSEFRDDVDRFARALVAMGVRSGDKVAIWATNVPAWYITFWAATKIGAVLVTVNTAYKIHEAEYLLRQSDTHTLVMIDGYKDSNYVEIIHELCPELWRKPKGQMLHSRRLPFLRNVVTIDSDQPGCYTWEEANALADEVPEDSVDDLRDVLVRRGLGGIDRSADRGEIRNILHIEDLRRADIEEGLQFALRPGLQETAENAAQGTQPANRRVDEVLDERAVLSFRQHRRRKVLRPQPLEDDERRGAARIDFLFHLN